MLIILPLIAGILLLAAIAVWLGSERAIHPQPVEVLPEPSDYPGISEKLQTVFFSSRDKTALTGWYLPGQSASETGAGPAPTIILLHGYASNKREMLPHADMLSRNGYNLLLFDFRGQGESQDRAVTFSYLEREDVLGAVAYLKSQDRVDPGRIGVLGVSMGGAAAIAAAAITEEIRAVAVEAAFSDLNGVISRGFKLFVKLPAFPFANLIVWLTERRLGIKTSDIVPVEQVLRIAPRPTLIMHGLLDKLVPYHNSERLFEAAGEPKDLWLIPDL
ncbi:MAG: alpha/beta hydrolase, partial [Dehalococcoidia bacterium]